MMLKWHALPPACQSCHLLRLHNSLLRHPAHTGFTLELRSHPEEFQARARKWWVSKRSHYVSLRYAFGMFGVIFGSLCLRTPRTLQHTDAEASGVIPDPTFLLPYMKTT